MQLQAFVDSLETRGSRWPRSHLKVDTGYQLEKQGSSLRVSHPRWG